MYRFLRQVRWSGIPISLGIFHTVKSFSVVNEVGVFLEFPCFLCDPVNVGYLISVRESLPRQVDRESRGPQGERGLELSRRKKGQTFFSFSTFLRII